ncbi:DUF4153 domain-containing protein [Wenyingzhuangia sp. chi5]|uniref:DUF4153 domain-containing protein n=1 Tax=Wenyingzhuangia gilva TaxID=3057677 RepID=A0ABT8VPF6_9FLAO|nr:DUF4153 domain-containing protein [Wenyingzhuangia sp. chi5]MDO3693854.1 DUF4153 domain-containing protein [Wenyingzhuangia sp. chi5]
MKFLSLKYLLTNAKSSFLRFPLVILSSFIAVVISIILVEYDDEIINKLPYINTLLTFYLGVPLFFCIRIFNKKNNLSTKQQNLLQISGLVLLGIIYISLPSIESTHNTSVPYIRYGVYNVIVHLLVSFAPYIKTKELNGFWNYNKALFLRICTSVLYASFIYIGLILAIFAVKTLFDVQIHEKLYFDIYIVIIGLFNTWFFVAGVPENLNELQNITEYPKGLKIFTQYVLLPLLIIYLVILYIYTGKIMMLWDWPQGIVSYLVSGISILGFFNILLMYPYGKTQENEWIQKFSKAFYYLLIPLVVVLFIALSMRVADYGITLKRYAAIALAIWISIVCIYFIFKKNNIKFIPISLAIILFITSFGPWGMFSVSKKNQTKRLITFLNKYELIQDGKIKNEVLWEIDSLPKLYSKNKFSNANILPDSIHNELQSIINYLDDYHGFYSIRPLFTQNIDSLINIASNQNKYIYESRIYMESLGLKNGKKYKSNFASNSWFSFNQNTTILNVKEYDYLLPFLFNKNSSKSTHFDIDGSHYTFKRKKDLLILSSENDTIQVGIQQIANKLIKEYGTTSVKNIPTAKMSVVKTLNKVKFKIDFQNINLSDVDTLSINNINGNLYIKTYEKRH